MNTSALVAVVVFAAALLSIFGALYLGASRSHARGEVDLDGIRLLRWAFLGYIILYVLLAITSFLT